MTFLQAPESAVKIRQYLSFAASPNTKPLPNPPWSRRGLFGPSNVVAEIIAGNPGYLRSGETYDWGNNTRYLTRNANAVNTDDQLMRITLAQALNQWNSGPCIKFDDTMQNGIVCNPTTSSERGLYTIINGTMTKVASFTNVVATGAGGIWQVSCVDNVYTVTQNTALDGSGGTVACVWTDTNRTVKTGPLYRTGGYILASEAAANGAKFWSHGWRDFDFRDVGWAA